MQDGTTTRTGVRLEQDGVAVELEWIGEGNSGDFDPADPDDERLLRFDVYRLATTDADGMTLAEPEWQAVDDASYCTQIPTTRRKRSSRRSWSG